MKLYDELANWWHLLSPPEEYAEEAAIFDRLLRASLTGSQRTLLEIGSGGGNNASHLKSGWQMTLVDLAAGMLAQSQKLNPECEHHLGDMRDVRLGRTFDAVFIHDAICYMTTVQDLQRAIETAYIHTRPGGVFMVVPDHTKENYQPSTASGGSDSDADGRAVRYLEWDVDPDPDDTTTIVHYAYLLRQADGQVRVEHDSRHYGLFSRQVWLDALTAAGFLEAQRIVVEHSELEPGSYQVFIGTKPEDAPTS